MEIDISGRTLELDIFNKMLQSERSEFVAVTGRRRVGKTFLIKHGFSEHMAFYFTGKKDATIEEQLAAFSRTMATYYSMPFLPATPENWDLAFEQLKLHLTNQKKRRKQVVFFDEVPWIATQKSGFLSALDHFWNAWAIDKRIILVICGSAASWITKNIVNNRGGLHNRLTQHINLKPFTLTETEAYLKKRHIQLPKYDILQLYMAMGGIPFYLNEVVRGDTAVTAIDRICFSEHGLLRTEFDNLYKALFDNWEIYEKIIKMLATKWKGLTRLEIIEMSGYTNGGGLTRILNDLEEASFIKSYRPFGKLERNTLYRLTDEYSLFYLSFITKAKSAKPGVWTSISQSQKYKAWAGFAFEGICIKHIDKIKAALGISGVYTEESSFVLKGNDAQEGFQIDLLIDRKDNAISICEMKFYSGKISVNKKYAQQLWERREQFRKITKTRKQLNTIMITTYGVEVSEYSLGIIDQVVDMRALF
ncbi:MAG: ATP-binding protein [Chitinophagales bacterium]|nr:ATP-binding protein [Chitinophagales bacterium]